MEVGEAEDEVVVVTEEEEEGEEEEGMTEDAHVVALAAQGDAGHHMIVADQIQSHNEKHLDHPSEAEVQLKGVFPLEEVPPLKEAPPPGEARVHHLYATEANLLEGAGVAVGV